MPFGAMSDKSTEGGKKSRLAVSSTKGVGCMGVPMREQETVVQYGRNGETMTIYTSDTTQMTRLDKIYRRHKEHRQEGEVVAVEYVVSKRLLSYRSKVPQSSMTDEQRTALSNRMKAAREKQLQANA